LLGAAVEHGERFFDAIRRADAHALTRAIGATEVAEIEPIVRYWSPGDVALLCPDGASDHLTAHLAIMLRDIDDLGRAAQHIVERAIQASGFDNATVVLARRAT
jgi:protein phosphatase